MITSDERASILVIIAAEQASVAHYAAQLAADPTHALAGRWKALKRWHRREITRRRKEMRER